MNTLWDDYEAKNWGLWISGKGWALLGDATRPAPMTVAEARKAGRGLGLTNGGCAILKLPPELLEHPDTTARVRLKLKADPKLLAALEASMRRLDDAVRQFDVRGPVVVPPAATWLVPPEREPLAQQLAAAEAQNANLRAELGVLQASHETQAKELLAASNRAAEFLRANEAERAVWSEAIKTLGWENATYSLEDLKATVAKHGPSVRDSAGNGYTTVAPKPGEHTAHLVLHLDTKGKLPRVVRAGVYPQPWTRLAFAKLEGAAYADLLSGSGATPDEAYQSVLAKVEAAPSLAWVKPLLEKGAAAEPDDEETVRLLREAMAPNSKRLDEAARELVFALWFYPAEGFGFGGPTACVLRALKHIAPVVAKDVKASGPKAAYETYWNDKDHEENDNGSDQRQAVPDRDAGGDAPSGEPAEGGDRLGSEGSGPGRGAPGDRGSDPGAGGGESLAQRAARSEARQLNAWKPAWHEVATGFARLTDVHCCGETCQHPTHSAPETPGRAADADEVELSALLGHDPSKGTLLEHVRKSVVTKVHMPPTVCLYCGGEIPRYKDNKLATLEALNAHVASCGKRPEAKLRAELDGLHALRRSTEALIEQAIMRLRSQRGIRPSWTSKEPSADLYAEVTATLEDQARLEAEVERLQERVSVLECADGPGTRIRVACGAAPDETAEQAVTRVCQTLHVQARAVRMAETRAENATIEAERLQELAHAADGTPWRDRFADYKKQAELDFAGVSEKWERAEKELDAATTRIKELEPAAVVPTEFGSEADSEECCTNCGKSVSVEGPHTWEACAKELAAYAEQMHVLAITHEHERDEERKAKDVAVDDLLRRIQLLDELRDIVCPDEEPDYPLDEAARQVVEVLRTRTRDRDRSYRLLGLATIRAEAADAEVGRLSGMVTAAVFEANRIKALLNTPELHDFGKAVVLEAAHQRERWEAEHDAGKTPADWYWLIGHLAGKCNTAHQRAHDERAGDTAVAMLREKAMHHAITTAAALANWHAAIAGTDTRMRPGIEMPAGFEATKDPHDLSQAEDVHTLAPIGALRSGETASFQVTATLDADGYPKVEKSQLVGSHGEPVTTHNKSAKEADHG